MIKYLSSKTEILLQTVFDANMFPVLIDIMKASDFKTRKEAAWALVNATSGGSPDQIRYLVNQGCIPPLCDFLTAQDAKIVQVALNGLENILKVGDADAKASGDVNRFAILIEECYGMKRNHIRTSDIALLYSPVCNLEFSACQFQVWTKLSFCNLMRIWTFIKKPLT